MPLAPFTLVIPVLLHKEAIPSERPQVLSLSIAVQAGFSACHTQQHSIPKWLHMEVIEQCLDAILHTEIL